MEISSQQREQPEPRSSRHSIKTVLCVDPDWTSEERRGVEFFLHVTVFKVINLNRDAVFWKEMLPWLTRLHPAFRHLAVAISSTHELLFNKDPDQLNMFALIQFTKATHLLRSSTTTLDLDLLLASCILVSAYSLLRCDLNSADRSIESGLRMAAQPGGSLRQDLKRILSMLGRQHGFKLWAPDITYQFERSNIANESLSIGECTINGPFLDPSQILAAYKTLNVEVIAKVMRNLTRGAYIDPQCSLSLAIVQQLVMFSFYFEHYSAQIPLDDTDTRLELMQLQLGFFVSSLIFRTKVISPNEVTYDVHMDVCQKVVSLGEEVLTALHAGQPVKYIDRFVNGTLFSFGFGCRDSLLRRRVINMLQSQRKYDDGLVNFVRGMVLYMVDKVENRNLGVEGSASSAILRRPTLAGLRCRDDDKMVCLEYVTALSDKIQEEWLEWDSSFDDTVSAQDINNCLQGIMTGYRMYGKPTISQAPRGYVREMFFRGRPVPVYWGEGCTPLQ